MDVYRGVQSPLHGMARRILCLLMVLSSAALAGAGILGIIKAERHLALGVRIDAAQSASVEILTPLVDPRPWMTDRGLWIDYLRAVLIEHKLDEEPDAVMVEKAFYYLDRALAAAPAEPRLWLIFAELNLRYHGATARTLEALRLSYRLGGYEGRLTERRLGLGLALWDYLTPDLRRDLEREYHAMMKNMASYDSLHRSLPRLYVYYGNDVEKRAFLSRGLILKSIDYRADFFRMTRYLSSRLDRHPDSSDKEAL